MILECDAYQGLARNGNKRPMMSDETDQDISNEYGANQGNDNGPFVPPELSVDCVDHGDWLGLLVLVLGGVPQVRVSDLRLVEGGGLSDIHGSLLGLLLHEFGALPGLSGEPLEEVDDLGLLVVDLLHGPAGRAELLGVGFTVTYPEFGPVLEQAEVQFARL